MATLRIDKKGNYSVDYRTEGIRYRPWFGRDRQKAEECLRQVQIKLKINRNDALQDKLFKASNRIKLKGVM